MFLQAVLTAHSGSHIVSYWLTGPRGTLCHISSGSQKTLHKLVHPLGLFSVLSHINESYKLPFPPSSERCLFRQQRSVVIADVIDIFGHQPVRILQRVLKKEAMMGIRRIESLKRTERMKIQPFPPIWDPRIVPHFCPTSEIDSNVVVALLFFETHFARLLTCLSLKAHFFHVVVTYVNYLATPNCFITLRQSQTWLQFPF